MHPILLALLIVLGVTLLIPGVISITVIPFVVFNAISKRTKPYKWSREHPSSDNPGIVEMWAESQRFRERYKDQESEVEATTSDGLNLKGLYYDFGVKEAVIILGGRPETCIYSLYYAFPYAERNVNVLVFDPRAHGLSEGEYSGCGYAEKLDLLAFVEVLKQKGIESVYLHGICVGSAAMSLLAGDPKCPSIVKGLFTDGVYVNYYETLKKRVKKNKGPIYPTVWVFRHRIKKLYGVDCKAYGPETEFPKISIPVYMVASKEDIFSLPPKTQYLYDICGSKAKTLDWFEHGFHSHLRRIDPVHYDGAVDKFLTIARRK